MLSEESGTESKAEVVLRIPEAGAGLLTVQEVADLLHVTKGTLRRWAKEGVGPPFYGWAKTPFYLRWEVSSWLDSRVRTPSRPRGEGPQRNRSAMSSPSTGRLNR